MSGQTIVVGISGASGVLYAVRLIRALLNADVNVMTILSHGGESVLSHEMGMTPGSDFTLFLKGLGIRPGQTSQLTVLYQNDMASAPASGSFFHSGMVVCPCSMKSLSAIAAGFADNLLTRSADVCLKENRPLILVPRETPYNLVHVRNMETVILAGGTILPPSPSFYSGPENINDLVDTVVARILDHLNINHQLVPRWGG